MSDQGAEVEIEVWKPTGTADYDRGLRYVTRRHATGILWQKSSHTWQCYVRGDWIARFLNQDDALSLVRAALASGGEQP